MPRDLSTNVSPRLVSLTVLIPNHVQDTDVLCHFCLANLATCLLQRVTQVICLGPVTSVVNPPHTSRFARRRWLEAQAPTHQFTEVSHLLGGESLHKQAILADRHIPLTVRL